MKPHGMKARGMETRGLRPARKKKRPPASFKTRPEAWEERPAARCSPTLLGVVPSPRGPLTSVFGKGTGVETPPRPPVKNRQREAKRWKKTKEPQKGLAGARRRARRVVKCFFLAPGPSALAAGRGAERASRTAYQNRSAETLAGLAHPACPPGRLPGAFSVLAHGDG